MTGSSSSSPASPGTQPRRGGRHVLRNTLLVIVGVLLVAFIAIQFVPVNRTNPPETTQIKWDSPQTQALAQRACMDCHSNETNWRWYSYVAPASWLIYYDVVRGRDQLNLSTLGSSGARRPNFAAHSGDLAYQIGQLLAGEGRRGGEGGEGGREFRGQAPAQGQQPPRAEGQGGFGGFAARRVNEAIQNGSMPPEKYILLHPEAKLSDAERQQLEQGLQATLSQTTGSTGAELQASGQALVASLPQ